MKADQIANQTDRTSSSHSDRADIARSLFGILPDDLTLEEAKEERLKKRLEESPEAGAGRTESGSGSCPRKETSTAGLFEEFYGKPFEEITESNIGPGEDIDWGEDVGGEKF